MCHTIFFDLYGRSVCERERRKEREKERKREREKEREREGEEREAVGGRVVPGLVTVLVSWCVCVCVSTHHLYVVKDS